MLIYFQGYETTGGALNNTLFFLAENPECQARAHEEIDRVFGTYSDRDVTFGDLSELKYFIIFCS